MSNPRIAFRTASEAPVLTRYNGKKILVELVVNVEHWRFDASMPRGISTPPQGAQSVPDVPNFAWAEYGLRVGFERMLAEIDRRALTTSLSLNSDVIEVYPQIANAALQRGWEFIGHGIHQRAIQHEPDEAAVIRRSLDTVQRFTGERVQGWLGPGLGESLATPDHLSALGIDYLLDWVLDDQPCWMRSEPRPLLSVPYNLELNDSSIYAISQHATGEFLNRLGRSLAYFTATDRVHVMAIGLHPHLMGVPHRIGEFAQMLDALLACDDVAFVQPRDIHRWYTHLVPA